MKRWPVKALGDVAMIDRVSVLPSDIEDGTTYLGLEHIESGGKILDRPVVMKGELKSSKFRFSSSHILYGKLRPYLAKITCPSFGGVCSTDILPILPNESIDRRYLCHYLQQPVMVELANSKSSGANLPRLSPKALAELAIPCPPLSEQKRIAEILDRAEALRSQRRAALALLDELTQSIFLDMFGDPITNENRWDMRRIDSICTLVRGSSPRPKGDPKYYGGPVPRLMVADITRDGWSVTPRIDSLTIEGAKKSRPVPKGTVVMAVSGNVGLVSRLNVDACVHDGFVAFTKLQETVCDPQFLLAVLHFSKSVHEKSKAGAIFINLTTNDIKKLEIPLPPISLQREFLRRLMHSHDLRIRILESEYLLAELISALQFRAFGGKL